MQNLAYFRTISNFGDLYIAYICCFIAKSRGMSL